MFVHPLWLRHPNHALPSLAVLVSVSFGPVGRSVGGTDADFWVTWDRNGVEDNPQKRNCFFRRLLHIYRVPLSVQYCEFFESNICHLNTLLIFFLYSTETHNPPELFETSWRLHDHSITTASHVCFRTSPFCDGWPPHVFPSMASLWTIHIVSSTNRLSRPIHRIFRTTRTSPQRNPA